MYLDFQDGHPDYDRVPSALSTREGVFLSIIVHLVAIILILVMPQLPFFKARAAAARAAAEAARRAMIERQKEPNRTFVFVQPRVELEPLRPPPPRAPLSDRDRTALSKERAPNPVNRQPFHRGNTPEFVEPSPPPRASRSPGATQPAPQTPPAESQSASRTPGNENAFQFPDAGNRPPARSGAAPPPGQTPGPLGEAIRNLSRYTEQGAFENPNGGDMNQFGPLQFDTKGVEFGPWVRRFVAQVKRNWFPPQAAMALRGHVVITFNVHKSGALTDLAVIGPSSVDSFNHSALNALATSNPTYPLPPEYPSEKAFFTVTFYYNEMPPQGP